MSRTPNINQKSAPSLTERAGPRLKVCGMKYPENIGELAALPLDYMGFIFWEPSSRFVDSEIPELPGHIKKTGVFVDAPVDEVVSKIREHDLRAVQLHGKETPGFCKQIKTKCQDEPFGSAQDKLRQDVSANKKTDIEIIKVFSIKEEFDFDILKPYEEACDYYLFDTKGKLPGGNGYTFDWSVLKNYPSQKPFFLSGGIGLDEVEKIKEILKTDLPIHAIDVNSRFEIKPGLKNIGKVKVFRKRINE